jgi:hypothetical protein
MIEITTGNLNAADADELRKKCARILGAACAELIALDREGLSRVTRAKTVQPRRGRHVAG